MNDGTVVVNNHKCAWEVEVSKSISVNNLSWARHKDFNPWQDKDAQFILIIESITQTTRYKKTRAKSCTLRKQQKKTILFAVHTTERICWKSGRFMRDFFNFLMLTGCSNCSADRWQVCGWKHVAANQFGLSLVWWTHTQQNQYKEFGECLTRLMCSSYQWKRFNWAALNIDSLAHLLQKICSVDESIHQDPGTQETILPWDK